jgi:hypothetical protein
LNLRLDPTLPLPLAAGWNLISLPLQPDAQSTQELLAAAGGKVWAWPTAATRDATYAPAAELTVERGYWVHCDTVPSPTVALSGTRGTGQNQTLRVGWNLIGPLLNANLPTGDLVTGTIWYWDTAGQRYQPATSLQEKVGYWVYSLTGGTVTRQGQ